MKRRRFNGLVFMLLLTLIIGGCSSSGNKEKADGTASPKPTQQNTQGTAESANPEPLGKYQTPIDISFVRSFGEVPSQNRLTTEGNEFIQFVEEKLGIRIQYKWVSNNDQYPQKLSLMLSSGDLADVMLVDMKMMYQMIDAGQIEPLTDAWNNYGDELTKKLMNPEGMSGFQMATLDGTLYGIPLTQPALETMHALFLREDWRVKLGLPEPHTMADLEKIMYAFANDDPDNNGKKDTYGIVLSKDLYDVAAEISSISNAYRAYPSAWIEKDGKIVYGSVQPEMKTSLGKLQQWFKDGLIDREFTVKNTDKAVEVIAKNQAGAVFGVQWTQFISGAISGQWASDPNSDWKLYPIPSADSEAAKPYIKDNTQQFIVVRKGFEHPEAVVKLLNLMHKLGAGDARDLLQTLDDFNEVWDGKLKDTGGNWTFMPLTPETIHGNVEKWKAVNKALASGDESQVEGNYNQLQVYRWVKGFNDEGGADIRKNGTKEQLENAKGAWGTQFSGRLFGIADELGKQGNLQIDKRGPYVSQTMVDTKATLEKRELETFTRIITGDASLDEFDEFVKQWNNLGGEQTTKEINDWYNETVR